MIEYRPIEGADIPRIIELYAQYLNSGDYYADLIRASWEEGGYQGYAAVEDGEIAAFLTIRPGIEFTYPHPELEAELSDFVQGKAVANCDAMLVLPEYRHRGIAHELAARVHTLLLRLGYTYFLAENWIYPDGIIPARPLFESLGKLVWQRRYDGFYRDLKKYEMSCPICGEDCVCGALIDLMELMPREDEMNLC